MGHQWVYMDRSAEGYREMGHRHPWVNVQKGIVRWDSNGFTWTVVQKGIVRWDIHTHGLTWTTNYTERSNNNGVRWTVSIAESDWISDWILTSCQPHRVTTGRHAEIYCTGQQWFDMVKYNYGTVNKHNVIENSKSSNPQNRTAMAFL